VTAVLLLSIGFAVGWFARSWIARKSIAHDRQRFANFTRNGSRIVTRESAINTARFPNGVTSGKHNFRR